MGYGQKKENQQMLDSHSLFLRAENEARTRDPNLGKVMLYQLSYFRNMFCVEFLLNSLV